MMNNVKVVNNLKTLYIDKHRSLSYRKGKLYIHSSVSSKPILFGNLPMTNRQRILASFRLTERLFRLEPRVAISIKDGYIISFCGSIYRVNLTNGEIINEHYYRQGMNNTMNLCKIEGIEGFDDCIAYGEYWGNTDKEEVSIYSRKENKWSKVFTFTKGKIRHIHGIIADHYRNGILILTGDNDEESGIWIARDNFKSVEPILLGSQHYRACVAFPVEEGIIYATDSPLEKNFIAIATNDKNGWKESILYDMPGPCIYGAKATDKYVFATSVEPDSRLKGIKYWVSYRLGHGIKDRYTHIIIGTNSQGFKDVIKFKKDIFPMLLFQFGNVQFPNGVINESIVMYPISVNNYDGKTVIYK